MNRQASGQAPGRWMSWRKVGWSFGALLLCVPAVAMQFTREVMWGPEDFLAAALLIGSAGIGFEMAARLNRSSGVRLALAAVVLVAVLLIWAQLAVGIVGD